MRVGVEMSELDPYEQCQVEMNESIQRAIDVGVAKCIEHGWSKDLAEKFCTMFVIGHVNEMGRANFNGPVFQTDIL